MENEIWKPIKGYENRYLISNYGRVISLARTFRAKDGFVRRYPERILKPSPNKTRGYIAVRLYDGEGSYLHKEIHVLVALHFLDNPNNFPVVNHLDLIRHNNKVENLEWCTYAHNLHYKGAFRKGREKMKKKVYQFTMDGDFIKAWPSATDATIEGFNRSGICNACNGHRPHYKGFVWRYH